MATPAYHYLSIFDGVTGRALWLGRTKRIASPDQRIVLHANDRGLFAPRLRHARLPLREVHHVDDWAQATHRTSTTPPSPAHHTTNSAQGWRTTKLTNGHNPGTPPPQLPLPSTTNDYHHPERFFEEKPDQPGDT